MAKLILQMQSTVDGYVSAESDFPWTVWDWTYPSTWDRELLAEFNTALSNIGTILLSRPMAQGGYIDHWTRMYDRHGEELDYGFLQAVVEAEKVLVTNKPVDIRWPNTRAATGHFAEVVARVADEAERDVICFGGAGFASALLDTGLVDELQLYVNPALVGGGRSFGEGLAPRRLVLGSSRSFASGIVVSKYAVA